MSVRKVVALLAAALLGLALSAEAQQAAAPADSAQAQVRSVLRAFYLNLESRNWEALAAYVLSPKLLERRGAPGELQAAARDRGRTRASSHPAASPVGCTGSKPPAVDQAVIHVDGDWAEASVPRCVGASGGTDEFRLLYFEERWRFIYTDLFEAPPPVVSAER